MSSPDVGATGYIWTERLPWSPDAQHGLFRCECVERNRSWRTWVTDTGVEFRTNGWGFVHPCPESALRARLCGLCHRFRPWHPTIDVPPTCGLITRNEFTNGVQYAVRQWASTRSEGGHRQ